MPQLAISNIAWPKDKHEEAYALLSSLGITTVEIAPLNLLPSWDCDFSLVYDLRRDLDSRGLSCIALQGILTGIENPSLFLPSNILFPHLKRVAQIAGVLGAKYCVFGAPITRNRRGISMSDALSLAAQFLSAVGPFFVQEGVTLTFEAVSPFYGCDFITTTAEAFALVKSIATPGIGLQIDTGTIFSEGENPEVISQALSSLASQHVHVSEPSLAPIGTLSSNHAATAKALCSYHGTISIEMRSTPTWKTDISNSINFVKQTYLPCTSQS